MVLIDLDKLSYTTLERIARDYGYDDVDQVIEKMEDDTEEFKDSLKDGLKKLEKQVMKIVKGEL